MTKFEKLAEQPTQTDLKFDEDFMFKFWRIAKARTYMPQHSHSFEHTTVLAAGAVRVWRGEEITESFEDHQAPALINIPAETKHVFMTLVDSTVLICATRLDADGDVKIAAEHQLAGVT